MLYYFIIILYFITRLVYFGDFTYKYYLYCCYTSKDLKLLKLFTVLYNYYSLLSVADLHICHINSL